MGDVGGVVGPRGARETQWDTASSNSHERYCSLKKFDAHGFVYKVYTPVWRWDDDDVSRGETRDAPRSVSRCDTIVLLRPDHNSWTLRGGNAGLVTLQCNTDHSELPEWDSKRESWMSLISRKVSIATSFLYCQVEALGLLMKSYWNQLEPYLNHSEFQQTIVIFLTASNFLIYSIYQNQHWFLLYSRFKRNISENWKHKCNYFYT